MQWLTERWWRVAGALAVVAIAVGAVVIAVASTTQPSHTPQRIVTAPTAPITEPTTTVAPATTPLPTLAPFDITTMTSPASTAAPTVAPTSVAPPSTSTTVKPGLCVPAGLAVTASPDHSTYGAGEPVVVTVELVDTGNAPCTVARSSSWGAVTISRKGSVTWDSALPEGTTLLLQPQQAVFAGSAVWDQYQCTSDPCGSGGPTAPPGSYEVVATVTLPGGQVSSARVTFATTAGSATTTTTPVTTVPPSTAPATGA